MRIRELDGLRGIAVLAVVGEHYFNWVPFTLFRYGWLGVDLFFILSGFLITSILLELRSSEHYFSVFYARRALRIFPPYYLALAIYLITSVAMGLNVPWRFWLQYFFYYTSLYVGQPDFGQGAFIGFPNVLIFGLVVLWSLSVEEIYYTIWAPIVRFTSQRSFSLLLLGMIVLAPALRIYFHTPASPEVYTFYCRMDGLAYGSAIALLVSFRRINPDHWLTKSRYISRVGWILPPITLVYWVIAGPTTSSVLSSSLGITLADVSFALITLALIRESGSDKIWVRFFRHNALRSIGMVSYTMYLCHYPLYSVSRSIVERIHWDHRILVILTDLLALLMTFIVSYSMWYLVESRILHWKDRIIPSPHPNQANTAITLDAHTN